jgi:MinD superfamily P-loop ATPase
MKQIVLVSGKGGTGKSTIAACLTQIVENKIIADCDVDAPNLHLLLEHELVSQADYKGANLAYIDPARCTACGICRQTCRFDAITPDYVVKPLACEGCAACTVLCPTGAISIDLVKTGESYLSRTDLGSFAHARLEIGAEGSGKLVTEVRKAVFSEMKAEDYVLIDGSPGIGCVIIASITATDAVVAVAEATRSGQHDLERVLAVADHFQVPAFVCINKWDLNPAVTEEIEKWCRDKGYPVLAKIPFDPAVMAALKKGRSPLEEGLESFVKPVRQLWQQLVLHLADQDMKSK